MSKINFGIIVVTEWKKFGLIMTSFTTVVAIVLQEVYKVLDRRKVFIVIVL